MEDKKELPKDAFLIPGKGYFRLQGSPRGLMIREVVTLFDGSKWVITRHGWKPYHGEETGSPTESLGWPESKRPPTLKAEMT